MTDHFEHPVATSLPNSRPRRLNCLLPSLERPGLELMTGKSGVRAEHVPGGDSSQVVLRGLLQKAI